MAADYRYLIADATAGRNQAEVPLDEVTFSTKLTGVGDFSATLPVDHAKATTDIFDGDREVTVFRDGVVVWNGPITALDARRSTGKLQISAAEPTWYLSRRYIEISKNYNADVFHIVRSLITAGTSDKVGGLLHNWSVTAGTAGYSRTFIVDGTRRPNVLDLVNVLAADVDHGFDYRIDYATGSARQHAQRTLVLGYPSLGITRTKILTEHVLADYGRVADRQRSANRVHVMGLQYVKTMQNDTSIVTDGDILLEDRYDATQIADHTLVDALAKEYRRLAQPPIRTFTASFYPSVSLPYGWCDLGDKVPLNISGPGLLATNTTRRVIEMETTPGGDTADETVKLTFNLPLDQLGA